MSFKIIIAGGRDFRRKGLLFDKCNQLIAEAGRSVYSPKLTASLLGDKIIILSGKAPGADKLGEDYAKEYGYKIEPHPAKWDDIEGKPSHEIKTRKDGSKYWIRAGLERNTEMAQEGNMLIAFWNGKSPGTRDMILKAHIHGLKVHVVMYD